MKTRPTPNEPGSLRMPSYAPLLSSFALSLVVGCSDPAPKAAAPAATVRHAVTEAQLTTVTLSPDAVRRLGIETATVESTSVAPTRSVGGEVVVPPGQSLIVTAPVAGRIIAPDDGAIPSAGTSVARRQVLMRLIALPPDRDLLRTKQDLVTAEARLRQAVAEAERVKSLYNDRLLSQRDNDRAQADLAAARAAHEAAAAQEGLVRDGAPEDSRGLTPLAIQSPDGGVVRMLYAGAGQSVAAGAPLAEILRLDRLWVRVPVYAGDTRSIVRRADALVHELAGPASGNVVRASPVAAPPSADPAASSVDLYYEIRGASSRLRPGERVGVTLTLSSASLHSLVVPFSAILRDMSGGSWVYERTDSVTFARRRVEVARIVGSNAVLASGPKAGTVVVTTGAAELFGTEFGAGK
ncbi:MAG: efflux RND transporter periplasmic adaptor subunit [Gemmatimonadaceae bacterium]